MYLSDADFERLRDLTSVAQEQGYRLIRHPNANGLLKITRGPKDLYESDDLDAIADWLA